MYNQGLKDCSDETLLKIIKNGAVPRHVAIIMDGNGRWASSRNVPRVFGHRQGMEVLSDLLRTSCEVGIEYLTLYAFSTENWKRPAFEVNALMALMSEYIDSNFKEINDNDIKVTVLGDIEKLPLALKKKISEVISITSNNSRLNLNVALNYGARSEIINAVKKAAEDLKNGTLMADDLDEERFSKYLYTRNIPDPDLLIRTGGDFRLSNFLLYQAAYTELYFTAPDVLWPDFNKHNFLKSIIEFQSRNRRYGDINTEQGY